MVFSKYFRRDFKKLFVLYITFGALKNDYCHSHKKQKGSLEGSLDRVSFAAELEFLKILVPRLPHRTSNVNIESPGLLVNNDSPKIMTP